ncbi:hypothetical protein OF83DRAFT_1179796 [Amylostereum chailletii]|nr:hypothetical protein OF83DRAFT_1179796 [Amylostereum chailletii]
MDNVSSNNVLARVFARLLMEWYGIAFHPDNAQIHCIAHVINLVIQKILSTAKEVDADPDVLGYYTLLNKHLPVHFDLDLEDEDLHTFEDNNYDIQAEGDADTVDSSPLVDPEEVKSFEGLSAIEKVHVHVLSLTASF